MVVIRLARGGSQKRPFYTIVYNPLASGNAETLRLSLDRVDAWVKTGAQASDAVNRLIVEAKKAAVPAA